MAKSPQLDTLLDTLLDTHISMAKKIKTQYNGHICDDCKHCEWHTQFWNLDPLGQPITFGCKLGIFEHGEVRGKRACKEWVHK